MEHMIFTFYNRKDLEKIQHAERLSEAELKEVYRLLEEKLTIEKLTEDQKLALGNFIEGYSQLQALEDRVQGHGVTEEGMEGRKGYEQVPMPSDIVHTEYNREEIGQFLNIASEEAQLSKEEIDKIQAWLNSYHHLYDQSLIRNSQWVSEK